MSRVATGNGPLVLQDGWAVARLGSMKIYEYTSARMTMDCGCVYQIGGTQETSGVRPTPLPGEMPIKIIVYCGGDRCDGDHSAASGSSS